MMKKFKKDQQNIGVGNCACKMLTYRKMCQVLDKEHLRMALCRWTSGRAFLFLCPALEYWLFVWVRECSKSHTESVNSDRIIRNR